MQSEETAAAVRQADIRRLVIRIGTYTNKSAQTCKGANTPPGTRTHTHTHMGVHTHKCADVFAQSIFALAYAHKCEHIKDENAAS